MNINILNESELQHYRLRTRRQKIRAQHKHFEKKLIALGRERSELYYQLRNLGWVDLDPPIMRGWKRFYVLRPDVARSKQAKFFEAILDKINTTMYSSRKDFKVKKRKFGKKVYVVKEQQLLQPDEWHFKKLSFSEAQQQLFEEQLRRDKYRKEPVKVYVFREPWRFILKVRPNWITKVRARDVAIEKRIKEINTFLERRCLEGRLYNLVNGYYQWWGYKSKPDSTNPLKNKPLERLLDTNYYYENEME